MCPPGCLHAICRTATRRGLLKTGLGLAAATAAAAAGVPAAFAQSAGPTAARSFTSVRDLSHALYEGFPTFSGEKWFTMEKPVVWEKDKVNLFRWTLMEHTGTHMDSPFHFSENGDTIDLIPVEDLVVPLAVIDIRARAAEDPDAYLTPDDVAAWEGRNGRLPDGAVVVMNSGWHALLDSPKFTGLDAEKRNHTPGFHPETTMMLAEDRTIHGIGVDTLSLDRGLASGEFPVHYQWLGSGRWGIEALAGLDEIPEAGALLVAGAPKVRGATGGPARIMALI